MESITESDFNRLKNDLYDVSINLQIAHASLRSCYSSNVENVASSFQEFVDLRRKVTKHAMVYNKLNSPIANMVIQNTQDFIENYTALSYEDFRECIDDLAETAR